MIMDANPMKTIVAAICTEANILYHRANLGVFF